MAQKTTVTLVDDLDGKSEASETVPFQVDGMAYEIDLTAAHAEEFRVAVEPFIDVARKAGRGSSVRAKKTSGAPNTGPSAEEVRAWAKSKKMTVSGRGRISAEVRQAYDAAH